MTSSSSNACDRQHPSSTATIASVIEGDMEQLRAKIGELLDVLPESRIDAKRLLENELEVQLDFAELNTLTDLAHDETIEPSSRNLFCLWYSTRLAAQRELNQLWTQQEIPGCDLVRFQQSMPVLLAAVEDLAQITTAELERTGDDSCIDIRLMNAELIEIRTLLNASLHLVPHLQALMMSTGSQEQAGESTMLSHEDRAMLKALAKPAGTEGTRPAGILLMSLALRTLILRDLGSWKELFEEQAEADQGIGVDGETSLAQLEMDRDLYHLVSHRLQLAQDNALGAGGPLLSKQMHKAKQDLFALYLELVKAVQLSEGEEPADEADDGGEPVMDLQKMLEEISERDAQADDEHARTVSKNKLYLDALADNGKSAGKSGKRWRLSAQKGERLRLRIMYSMVGVLLVACVVYHAVRSQSPGVEVIVPLSEFSGPLAMTGGMKLGSMMYAEVNSWVWADLSEAARIEHVSAVGRQAADQGFKKVYLTDELKQELASWTESDGVQLSTRSASN